MRSNLVIESLRMRRADAAIHIRSTAPQWLFHDSVRVSRQSIDIGMIQRDSLDFDVPATLRACRNYRKRLPELIQQETEYVKDHDVGLIVADIPPLAFEIAARLSIPSVAVTNFTWNWIYRSYTAEYPAFIPLIEELEEFYSKATLALILPYPGNMGVFPRREPIPWMTRRSTLTKEQARQLFDLPQKATVVLLSFGGLGVKRLPWAKLKELREFLFIATGESREHHGNLRTLAETQRDYQDLVRAADVIVTKPGYGIVADALAHQVRILYTDRGDFPEYFRLVDALRECAIADYIPRRDLLNGNLTPYLHRLLEKEHSWPAVSLDGAAVAAEKILALLG